MKAANIDVHGVYSLCNTGSIEVHIEEGYDPLVYWRYSIMGQQPQNWRKAKIYYTAKGRAFFLAGGIRVHLNQVLKV